MGPWGLPMAPRFLWDLPLRIFQLLHAGIFSLWDHVSQSISLLPTSGIFILSRPCASFISWPCALFISWPRAFFLSRPSAIFIYILRIMPQSFHLASCAGARSNLHTVPIKPQNIHPAYEPRAKGITLRNCTWMLVSLLINFSLARCILSRHKIPHVNVPTHLKTALIDKLPSSFLDGFFPPSADFQLSGTEALWHHLHHDYVGQGAVDLTEAGHFALTYIRLFPLRVLAHCGMRCQLCGRWLNPPNPCGSGPCDMYEHFIVTRLPSPKAYPLCFWRKHSSGTRWRISTPRQTQPLDYRHTFN